ncbi:MAG: fimbrillin family protein [Candidatus Cryptobacteroides sp.]
MKRRTVIYTSILLILASCGISPCEQEPGMYALKLNVNAGMQECGTKSPIFPSGDPDGDGCYAMPDGSTYGLFICKHSESTPNPYSAHSTNYNNIQVSKTGASSWNFTYGSRTDESMYILRQSETDAEGNEQTVKADIFAYAPYDKTVTSPEMIPYQFSLQSDLMYAAQNMTGDYKGIDPETAAPNPYPVNLVFRHALALLEFNFRLKNNVAGFAGASLSKITVTAGNETPKENLYTDGTFNSVDGTVTGSVTGELSIDIINAQLSSANPSVKAYMLMMPTSDYEDDDFKFTFHFDNVEITTSPFLLKREHLEHSDGTTYGLQAGYKYSFNFVLDNYLHFSGVQTGEWTTEDEPLINTEI